MPRMYCSHVAYCTTLDVQTFTTSRLPRDPSCQRWNYVGEKWPMNFAWNARLPRSIQESFTCRKSTTWDRRIYFPSEGRRAEDFFALKNPTDSAGFEPANLGTKDQHATSRPPKPLNFCTWSDDGSVATSSPPPQKMCLPKVLKKAAILYKMKLHYSIHKSCALVTILIWNLPSYFLKNSI